MVAREAASTAPYLDRFAAMSPDLPGAALPWLATLRHDAIERFAETGFPTPRLEAWKYTDLRRMLQTDFAPAPAAAPTPPAAVLDPWRLEGPSHLLVFVDGRFAPALSAIGALPPGVRLEPLAALLASDPAALEGHLGRVVSREAAAPASLNTAFMGDGAVLRLDPGAVVEDPVQLLFVSTGGASTVAHPRNLVLAGEGSRATMVETYTTINASADWTNTVTEIIVGPGAALHHYKLQQEGDDSYHIGLTRVRIERDGAYTSFVMSLGARLARNEIDVLIAGDGVECRLNGAYLLRRRQHADNTTQVEHAGRHSRSRQVYKGVIDERARAVFQGRVLVREGAQGTDAHQLNRNLLLSPNARADSKPELVIHADDVKCGHGATVGDLDKAAMFYLRARGIDQARARALLIEAFIGELLDDVTQPAVQTRLRDLLGAWLGDRSAMEAAA